MYDFLSRLPVTKRKYALKFFFIAAPVVVIALGELVVFSLIHNGRINVPFVPVVLSVYGLILAACVIMLYFFRKLIRPLSLAQRGLTNYVTHGALPDLPLEYSDEAGVLMASVQTTLEQLDRLLVEKNDMIGLLSHDLRSPVARIQSLSGLIKNDDGRDKNLYADYIVSECKGLLRMLENMLLMLKEDHASCAMSNVNLRHLVEDTVSFFDFALSEKYLEIEMCVDDRLVIHVQPELFTQAVRNIVGNAIKFSDPGKTIYISGRQIGDQVSICVRDEGVGFHQNDMLRIFERFTGAGKKGTRGEASIGLGLYLSKKIIEKHGGNLLAESGGINKGAAFTIVLNQLITKKPQDKAIKKPHARPVYAEAEKIDI